MSVTIYMEDCIAIELSSLSLSLPTEIGVDMKGCQGISFTGEAFINAGKSAPSQSGKKVGRNESCPCGSGKKNKHCHGNNMSTGIRSNDSSFTVGKLNTVADIGIDLQNKSHAQIDELNHYAPDTPAALIHALKGLPVQPPAELVKDAIEHQKATGSIDGSRLWDWFSKQGINVSFWAQLSVAIAALG